MFYTSDEIVLETKHHYVIRNKNTNDQYWVYRKGLTCGVRCGVISGKYKGEKLDKSIQSVIKLNLEMTPLDHLETI